MYDIMIDLETLAISEDCTIASIGAVLFDTKSDAIGKSALWKCNLKQDRYIDPDTVKWWLQQSQQAIGDTFLGETVTLSHALNELYELIKRSGIERVWANSPTFDLAALKHAYNQIGHKCPWTYRQECDVRTTSTILKLYGQDVADWVKFEGTAHNPVDDCIYQSKCVQKFYEFMVTE